MTSTVHSFYVSRKGENKFQELKFGFAHPVTRKVAKFLVEADEDFVMGRKPNKKSGK